MGNPITYNDINGDQANETNKHIVRKGETLSSIGKRFGVSVEDLASMNNIADKNKISTGTMLSVSPEVDFSNNPRGGYRNPSNESFEDNSTTDHTLAVATKFVRGLGAENTAYTGGNARNEVASLPSVRDLIQQGLNALGADGKFVPGEAFSGSYRIGSITSPNGKRIIGNSIKNFLNPISFNPLKNEFFQAENILGSYGFSMRVNADGNTATISVYDAKTIQSLSDHKANNSDKTRTSTSAPAFSNTYQRYIWQMQLKRPWEPTR